MAVPSAEAIHASDHEIVAVLTRPPAAQGRSKALVPSPVAQWAMDNGIPVLDPVKVGDDVETIAQIAPDCCPVVAYGNLIPARLLEVPRFGWVNLHFSLLPAWRGAAPVQAAILHGDDVTGASTFLLEEGLDTGPVFGVVTESIRPTDTSADLLQRLSISGAGLLVATLDAIASGAASPVPQGADGVSHAGKVTVADAQVDWTKPAMYIDRHIRSVTPAPGAWTTFRGERLRLGPVRPTQEFTIPAGLIVAGKRSVLVGTATNPVELTEVIPAGKKPMAAADWARGARIEMDEVFV